MPKIILTIGAGCSGKTTYAEELIREESNIVNINRDDIRFSLFTQGVRDWSKYKFNNTNEKRVTEVQEEKAKWARKHQLDIIISDTNLNPKIRKTWQQWANKNKYEYEEKLFPCPWETLVKRNSQRFGGLSESLLWDQYVRYERQFGDIKPYLDEPALFNTVICDIDGTIAKMNGRSPFEWGKVGEDLPREDIITMVKALGDKYHHITFMSGRDGICYNKTYMWLVDNIGNNMIDNEFTWDLYMRPEGDSRKDSIIKDELYEKHIRGKMNVSAVLDDRKSILRLWELKGMPNIINVGNLYEEF